MINMIALLQIATVIASGGDVYLLGEAYAFGVVWSFFLKALGVSFLRFMRNDQEYKVPLNFRVGGREWPVGLILTTSILAMVAVGNLFSKKIATIYGILFTLLLFATFTISERINARKRAEKNHGLEEFNLDVHADVAAQTVQAREGCILVAVRDPKRLKHLETVLQKTNMRRHDIVVMTVRQVSTGAGEYDLGMNQLFTEYEKELFTRVVALAEKQGKSVDLLVVPGVDPFDAMVQTAARLKASRLVTGVSEKMDQEELARRVGLAWERLPEPRHPFSLEAIPPTRKSIFVNLGPHPPRLWPEDISRLHDIWLQLSERYGSKLHHRDVVGVALRRMERELQSGERSSVMQDIEKEIQS
jgi:nucleotide-binding universal stress UspA family protein